MGRAAAEDLAGQIARGQPATIVIPHATGIAHALPAASRVC